MVYGQDPSQVEETGPQRAAKASDGPAARPHGALGELLARPDALDAECARLLEVVRSRCPGLLPPPPLDPGTAGPEVQLNPGEVQKLVAAAAGPAAGVPSRADSVVWAAGGNELAVLLEKVRVRLEEGIVLVEVPVHCDQVPDSLVTVAFAVGDDRRPAGMLAVTEDRPRGPSVVVDVWGEALTAFAWQVLVAVATGVAGGAGADVDGAPLVPAGIKASGRELRVLTMARHAFDRALS